MKKNRNNLKVVLIRAVMAAVYASGALAGGYVLLGDGVDDANAETIQSYWSHHGDINENGITDANDLIIIADNWLTYLDTTFGAERDSPDLDGDGWANLKDFAIVAENWGWEKPDGAVMEAYVSKVIGGPPEVPFPYCGVKVQIHNLSPEDNSYDMGEVTFNSGSNNGVNDVYIPPKWDEDHETDPNITKTWKTNGGKYIDRDEIGFFEIYATGNLGEDPNDFKTFKRDHVNAKTKFSDIFDFTPLVIDLPHANK